MKRRGFARVRGAALEALLLGASLAAAGSLSSTRASKLPSSEKGKPGKSVPAATRAGEPGLTAWILGETATSTNEFRINTYTTRNQSHPRVAADTAGNFVVVWQSYSQDGSFYGIFGQRFASGGAPLGFEFPVNTFTTSYQSFQSVARAAGGSFVVVWQSYPQDGSQYGVFGQRYDADGARVGGEFRANTYTTNAQFFPCVASDSSGNFVVAWERLGASDWGLFAQRFTGSGAPLGSEFRVDSFTTNVPSSPAIASDPAGNFVVVWNVIGASRIEARLFDATGAPLGAEFQVNTVLTASLLSPSVARGASGDFVVVWQENQDGSSYGVFGRRYGSAGVPLGGPFRVNTYTSGSQGVPAVSFGAAGDFVVTWQSDAQDGSAFGIFGQRYDLDGAPAGPEFPVNITTRDFQVGSSVASRPGGGFVVVWQSNGQDGSMNGIFGRRFCSNLSSVTIDVTGATTICPTSMGGMATVADVDGGVVAHQWGYSMIPGGAPIPIDGQTGSAYAVNGANFPGPGFYYLFCFSNPECGTPMFSNEIVVIVAADMTAPLVQPPRPATFTQTICN